MKCNFEFSFNCAGRGFNIAPHTDNVVYPREALHIETLQFPMLHELLNFLSTTKRSLSTLGVLPCMFEYFITLSKFIKFNFLRPLQSLYRALVIPVLCNKTFYFILFFLPCCLMGAPNSFFLSAVSTS